MWTAQDSLGEQKTKKSGFGVFWRVGYFSDCEVVAGGLWLRGGGFYGRPGATRRNRKRARNRLVAWAYQEVHVEDCKEVFVREYVFAMLRANPLYEGSYLLGTAIARPLIAQGQIRLAQSCGADAVAHGATGKGNDQVAF